VLAEVQAELAARLGWLGAAAGLDLAVAEGAVRERVPAVGARLLEAGLASPGAGEAGPRGPCRCGAEAGFEGYRPKGVRTPLGWVAVRRAHDACPGGGHGRCPLDAELGPGRDGPSPGGRSPACRFGALPPSAPAAAALAEEGRALPCRGEAAAVRGEPAGDLANQAPRMRYAEYRAAGRDTGSGRVEGAGKHLNRRPREGPRHALGRPRRQRRRPGPRPTLQRPLGRAPSRRPTPTILARTQGRGSR